MDLAHAQTIGRLDEDMETWNVVMLKERCGAIGIAKGGTKPALIARLRGHMDMERCLREPADDGASALFRLHLLLGMDIRLVILFLPAGELSRCTHTVRALASGLLCGRRLQPYQIATPCSYHRMRPLRLCSALGGATMAVPRQLV